MEKLRRLFTRCILKESAAFKKVTSLSESDMEFIKSMGIYAYEGFRGDLKEVILRAEANSNLFEQLRLESIQYLEGTDSIYWNQKEFKEGKEPKGIHVVSLSKHKMKECKGTLLSKYYDPERLIMYLPVLEDWARHYIGTSKESFDKKLILNSIINPLKEKRMHKLCLYNSGEEELVEVIKK
jgi:hypothetical protein